MTGALCPQSTRAGVRAYAARLCAGAAAVLLLAAPGCCASAFAAEPRVSLPQIERQFMCVTCKIPLNVAQSPQADRERAFIDELIHEGDSEAQIRSALVAQYGPTVLGLPSAHGFDATVYVVPAAVVLALLALLALLLPRWRRAARAQAALPQPAAELSADEQARLDAELARFD